MTQALATIDVETGEIVERPRATVQLTNEQLQYIAHTEFVPKGLRGNVPAIMACVATGRALGIDDMSALRSINVIDGKPSFSAELMVMLVRRDGHSITGDVAEGRAIARGKRQDNGDEITVEWTLEMARTAGLLGKKNWKEYPESMLWARAVSQLCRMLFADVFVGGTYTTEELEPADPLPKREVVNKSSGRKATKAQHAKLGAIISELNPERLPDGVESWEVYSRNLAAEMFGVESRADLTVTQMSDLIEQMQTADVPFG